MAAALPAELVEEIFLHVPPDDEPVAFLARAALVCKSWCPILSDGGFLRRYRRFHFPKTPPPQLGYIHNGNHRIGVYSEGRSRFVADSIFSPPPAPAAAAIARTCRGRRAIDCCHGRVLIHARDESPSSAAAFFVVWDPVTGSQEHVSMPPVDTPYPCHRSSWAAAVLCAVVGCDHVDCHGGRRRCPFLVVFVETRAVYGVHERRVARTCASVYSSRTGAWSAPAPHGRNNRYDLEDRPSLLLGGDNHGALYFTLRCDVSILRYDLGRHRLSIVDAPPRVFEPVPVETADGELGFVAFSASPSFGVDMWSRRKDAAGTIAGDGGAWERHRIVELDALLLPVELQRLDTCPNDAIRFAEGTNSIFVSMYETDNNDGVVFALDLKSRQLSKVARSMVYPVLPYI